jgi:hypothetical protein
MDERLNRDARRLLDVGTVSAPGQQFARGAWAVASRLSPAMRHAALDGMVDELAATEPALAVHVVAGLLRLDVDAAIRGARPVDAGRTRRR